MINIQQAIPSIHMQDKYRSILEKYLPAQSLDYIHPWLVEHKVQLRISRRRITKTGDYRPPVRHRQHRISVNGDLNKQEFLITLVHEMDHLDRKSTRLKAPWKGVESCLQHAYGALA